MPDIDLDAIETLRAIVRRQERTIEGYESSTRRMDELEAEVERLSRRLGMTRDNAADDLAELRAENERLRDVAEAAGELTYCIGNAGSADIDRAALAVDAALDALDAGGDTDA